MIESPVLLEFVSEIRQNDVLRVLSARLGAVPQEIIQRLRAVQDMDELDRLMDLAVGCHDLAAFANGLGS